MEEKILAKGEFSGNKFGGVCLIAGVAYLMLGGLMNAEPSQYFGLFLIAVSILLFLVFGLGKHEMVVTDKRVYGKVRFGRRVDLPLDSITAIGLSIFKSIAVTTASGAIRFSFMKNRDEVYNVISKLLRERQEKRNDNTNQMRHTAVSDADELQKYKNLLDSGVITKEEFDAKKKQLLGI